MATTKSDTKLQTEPGDTVAPQQTTDTSTLDSVQLLALAGDENARRALGLPTSGMLQPAARPAAGDGFNVGQTATEGVYESTDGKLVRVKAGETPDGGSDGFRGTLLVAAGDTVTPVAAARIAQG